MRLRSAVALTLAAVAAPARAGLPRAVVDRPVTLPGGVVELGVDAAGTRVPDDGIAAAALALGVTDSLEVDARYAGGASIGAGVRVLDGTLEVALRVRRDPDAWSAGAQLELRLGDRVKLVSSGDQLGDRLAAPIALGVQLTPIAYAQLGARIPIDAPTSAPIALDAVIAALASMDLVGGVVLDDAVPGSLRWSIGLRYRPR